jgi:hypothetical protein
VRGRERINNCKKRPKEEEGKKKIITET